MQELSIFVGALAVAYLVPGADMLLVIQTGARAGRRPAMAVALGLGLARSAHVALAALGLAAVLRAAPWAFDLIRLAGAAYLVWLGVGILRMPSLAAGPGHPVAKGGGGIVLGGGGRTEAMPCRSAVLRGLLTNLLNPKALLFCSVLLPQFVHAGTGGIGGQFLWLGSLLVAIGLAFDTLYALAGAALAELSARHRMVDRIQRWSFGSVLIGFGAQLALASRL